MLKKMWQSGCVFGVLIAFLAACGSSSQSAPSYQETKKTVIDILKTDEGKKAVHEILADQQPAKQKALDSAATQDAIVKALTDDKAKASWSHVLSDPDFQKKLSKAMQQEQGDLLKKMINDPEYQQMMMSVLQAPHMESEYLSLMKTKPYREQMQKVVMQTVSSPLFASQIKDAIEKVIKDEMKKGNSSSNSGQQSQNKPTIKKGA